MFCPDDGAEIREHTHSHTYAHPHAYPHTHSHAYDYANTYTHDHTYTHTYAEYVPCSKCGVRYLTWVDSHHQTWYTGVGAGKRLDTRSRKESEVSHVAVSCNEVIHTIFESAGKERFAEEFSHFCRTQVCGCADEERGQRYVVGYNEYLNYLLSLGLSKTEALEARQKAVRFSCPIGREGLDCHIEDGKHWIDSKP
jgi:hypothetical protein